MFDYTSRYYPLDSATHTDQDGRRVSYKRRRFLPAGKDMPLLVEVGINAGDRLDLITARTLGDPLQFWRVADANDTMNPEELTDELGRVIRVPVPQT